MTYPSLKAMAEGKVKGVQKTTNFQVDPKLLEVEDGFNARPIDWEHVQAMMESVLAGSVLPPIFVRVDGGRVIVVDGHHRLAAMLKLIEQGHDIRRMDCIQFRGNDVDRIALMLTSAQGKPLTPLEAGLQYKKLVSMLLTPKEIAAKVGKTDQHVRDMLMLANANSDVHRMIQDGSIAAKTALQFIREYGGDAGVKIKEKLKDAQGVGKKKVTAKTAGKKKKQTSIEDVMKALHYPDCWDTAAYPTVLDAVLEVFKCSNDECKYQTTKGKK